MTLFGPSPFNPLDLPEALQTAADKAAFIRANWHEVGNVPNYEDVLQGAYERFLRPGDTVIDIGAHTGRHTAHFAALVGREGHVWAFEPLPAMAGILRNRFGHMNEVTLDTKALSSAVGTAQYKFVTNAPEESGLQERIYNISNPIIETIDVEVSTVDTLFPTLGGVSYVKIDIEGGEIDCLAGMNGFLRRNRPIVSVEYGFPGYSRYGSTKDSLFDAAMRYDYRIADLFGTLIKERAEWHQVCDVGPWDFFLVPCEMERFPVRTDPLVVPMEENGADDNPAGDQAPTHDTGRLTGALRWLLRR